MFLVEIFLPVTDNDKNPFPGSLFGAVRKQLTDRFDGVTSFSRAPAHGVTREDGKPVHDDIVVMEVMADTLDLAWWKAFRGTLEQRFAQERILIRSTNVEVI
jgi:hypothetical protein